VDTMQTVPKQTMPLTTWMAGDEGVIETIVGSHRLALRLREVGAVPGALVRVLRSGCPLIIQVGTSRFCLRNIDAGCIRGRRAA
jgi:Fe2+ transport system protein FeoA